MHAEVSWPDAGASSATATADCSSLRQSPKPASRRRCSSTSGGGPPARSAVRSGCGSPSRYSSTPPESDHSRTLSSGDGGIPTVGRPELSGPGRRVPRSWLPRQRREWPAPLWHPPPPCLLRPGTRRGRRSGWGPCGPALEVVAPTVTTAVVSTATPVALASWRAGELASDTEHGRGAPGRLRRDRGERGRLGRDEHLAHGDTEAEHQHLCAAAIGRAASHVRGQGRDV